MRGCLGRLLLLGLLLVGAIVVWQNRDRLQRAWDQARGHEAEASPELAAQADNKLASLGENGGARRVALSGTELQSLIEYRWGGLLPQDVSAPRIRLGEGRVTLEGNVATARFGRIAELREIIAILPDTTALRAVGTLVPLDDGQAALEVHEVAVASVPIPARLIPTVLSRFPGAGDPGVPSNAVVFPLPPGISAVFVSGDSMVFVANRAESG
jgi:hypothetical protein